MKVLEDVKRLMGHKMDATWEIVSILCILRNLHQQ